MSLKDKMLKRSKEINANRKDFTPMELNETNVNAIYNRCAAHPKKGDSKEDYYISFPFLPSMGYKDSYIIVYFNKKELDKNKANLLYMLGQIKDISKKENITISDLSLNYSNKLWTMDPLVITKLAYISAPADFEIFSFFDNRKKQNSAIIAHQIEPTLSPDDPHFKEWYKGYAKKHPELNIELEPEGIEPADN